MALDLTPEQKELGKENFVRTVDGLTRRGFLKGVAAAAAGGVAAAAAYYGYKGFHGKPVRAGLIGAGDEGGVLVGEHNPAFLEFVGVADVRPSNLKRIFEGELAKNPSSPRKGFNHKDKYGKDARKKIKQYDDYRELLANKDIEAVVIALPLHLHAPVAIEAMRAGKHVLCEKLMAWNVDSCKKMIQVAKETKRILSIGHQRHYSLLYAHASEVINAGVLGEVKHIRALWHRNFSWPFQPPGPNSPRKLVDSKVVAQPEYRDSWFPPIYEDDYNDLKDKVRQISPGKAYDSVEELIRWRLYNETGGGLMAELGSHQLDACSIFLGKVHPLAVSGTGVKSFFGKGRNDRDIDDHVFVTFEFPGRNHPRGPARPDGSRGNDPHDVVVVTYSSISTNQFEQYGECVMGTRGTMVVEGEKQVMLYSEKDPNKKDVKGGPRSLQVSVVGAAGGKPALDTSGSEGGPAPTTGEPSGSSIPGVGGVPISRGYKEEMEHFAYCIRKWDGKQGYEKGPDGKYVQDLPRCHGEVAMADAILALTANRAMHNPENQGRPGRIEFKYAWFDAESKEVPDGDTKPKVRVDLA